MYLHFKDRIEAGQKLAKLLSGYRKTDCIVYALPRGGVVLGAEIANYLKAPLDLVITRKVGSPSWAEYAICAVSESGNVECNADEVKNIDPAWLKLAIEKEKIEAKRRHKAYLSNRPRQNPKNKIAIITDDGIATGLTMIVAVRELRDLGYSQIVVAVPVAPKDVVERLKKLADNVIVLDSDEPYQGSVGSYYDDFHQVSDEEVIDLLDGISR